MKISILYPTTLPDFTTESLISMIRIGYGCWIETKPVGPDFYLAFSAWAIEHLVKRSSNYCLVRKDESGAFFIGVKSNAEHESLYVTFLDDIAAKNPFAIRIDG